jgi:hypothetical protein
MTYKYIIYVFSWKAVEHCDGYDCGDEVAAWLKAVLKTEKPLRLLYYAEGLEGRHVITDQDWYNNPFPDRNEWVFRN